MMRERKWLIFDVMAAENATDQLLIPLNRLLIDKWCEMFIGPLSYKAPLAFPFN